MAYPNFYQGFIRIFLLSVAGVTLAASCSSSDAEEATSSSAVSVPLNPEQPNAEVEEHSSAQGPDDSGVTYLEDLVVPDDIDAELVIRFMGLDWSLEKIQAESTEERALHEARENMIHECMGEHGFNYTHQQYEEPIPLLSSDDYGGFASREWHTHYGYGISTSYWPQELLPDDVLGDPSEYILDSSSQHEIALSDLSDEEAQAYFRALYGDEKADGCDFIAWEETVSEFQRAVRSWSDLLYEIAARVLASEPMIAYETELTGCVTEKGYTDFAGATVFMDGIATQLDTLFSGVEDGLVPPDKIVDAMRVIQQQEREVAVAEFDCRLPQEQEIALFRSAVEAVLDEHR